MTSIPLSDMEGGNAASFNEIGDKYAGRIMSAVWRQQTDLNTGQLKTWQDGSPAMLLVVTIQPLDGDAVQLWARKGNHVAKSGSGEAMLNAIGAAVRAAGGSALEEGGQLAVAFTGLGESKQPGFNPPKLYTAQYQPPKQSVPVDLFTSE